MFRNIFLKGLLFTLTLTLLVFLSNVTIVKANGFTNLTASVWNSIGDFLFGNNDVTPEVPVVIPPKVTPKKVTTPTPVVVKPTGLTTYVTNTLTDDQVYTALTKLKKLPQNIIDLLHVSTPVVTNVYNNSTSGGSGGTVSDSKWHSKGNSISHSGAVTVEGELGVTGTSTLADLHPQTAGSVTSGVTTTTVVTNSDSLYDDNEKFIAIGPDGFVRFVYYNNGVYTDLHFVQCLDQDCTTKNDTVIVVDPDEVDSPVLVMGSDGFARIAYMNYASPEELHYIQCTNADCSSNNNNIFDSGGDYYEIGLALDSSGNANIVYNDSTNDPRELKLAQCSNADCSDVTTSIIITNSADNSSDVSIQIASDGFPRIAYSNRTTEELHFIQCTNTDCSSKNDNVIDDSANVYYLDMVLGADGFGRIVYETDSPQLEKFAQCINDACSDSNITTIYSGSDISDQNTIVMGLDGLPRISYDLEHNAGEYYVQCTNADCSSKNTKTIDDGTGGYPESMALGADGFARILYMNADQTDFYLARFSTDDGSDVITGSTIGTSDTPFGQIYGTQLYLNGSIFDPSAVATQWTTSGSNIYFNSGNVGIGTTNPSTALQLGTLPGSPQTLSLFGSGQSHFTPTGQISFGYDNSLYSFDIINTNSGYQGEVLANGLIFATRRNSDTDEPVMIIGTDHNVGIGTTTPSALLNVRGYTANSENTLYVEGQPDIGQNILKIRSAYNAGDGGNLILATNNSSDMFVVNNTGQVRSNGSMMVGSNGTQPTSSIQLQVLGAATGDTTGGGLYIDTQSQSDVTNMYSAAYIVPRFANASYTVGNVNGVVIAGPAEGSGATFTNTTGLNIGNYGRGGTTLSYGLYMANQTGSTTNYAIYSVGGTNYFGGRVGIGMSDPSVALDVTGDIEYTGTITDVSDRRLKENITDFSGALNIISKLEAKNYNMISSPDKPEVGFIAQDVQSLFPSATSIIDPTNGYLGVSYVSLVPVVAEAVKELNLKVDNLTTIPTDGTSNSFLDRLISWLGDQTNGVVEMVSGTFRAKNELCINDTCVNEDQLKQLLQNQNIQNNTPPSSNDSDFTPPTEPATPDDVTPPVPEDSTTNTPPTVTPDTSTPPAPDTTPSSDPIPDSAPAPTE